MRVCDALLPRLAGTYGVGLASAADVITVFAVAYGACQVVFGPLGDRYGKLRVITGACLAASVANLACALAPGFPSLLVARVLAGAACACIIPLSMAWIGDTTPYESRQGVLARYLLGQIFGMTSGSVAGGFAAESGWWQWPFVAVAGAFLVVAWLLGRAARDDRGSRRDGGHLFADIGKVLAVPWARVVILTVFAEGAAMSGGLAFVASHLHLERGASLALAGVVFTGYGLGGVAFALLAGRAARRLGEVRLATIGTAAISLSIAIVAFVPSLAAAGFGCFGAGLGFYMLHNTLQTNATQMAPERRGAAVALFASLFFIGQSIGVALTAQLVERAGTSWGIAASAAAIVPVGMAFAILRARRG
ncbi:MAG: MFS transporter [Betaproteobacteria bacterium]|nr:MFS transporter [Betaproteobacteria bacterium]